MAPIRSFSPVQRTDYDSIADKYDILERNAVTLWHLGYRYLLRHLNPVKGKSIIDYGCGSGTFCRLLREHEANVTGVDISENMITVAKEKSPDDIAFHHITSGNLDFLPECAFDFAVSNFVLCTMSTRDKITRVMSSINRVLKKDGSLLILNSNWDRSNGKEFISFKLQYCKNLFSGKSVTAVIKTNPPIILNDYFWSKTNYVDLLIGSGFNVKSIEEPLAKGFDLPWVSEKSYPPYYIIHAKK